MKYFIIILMVTIIGLATNKAGYSLSCQSPCLYKIASNFKNSEMENQKKYVRNHKVDEIYRHSKKGLTTTIYNSQKKSSKRRKHPMPDYSLQQFRQWCFSQPLFHVLYKAWVKSEYNKMISPSPDRKNDYMPYTLANLQLMTWRENSEKAHADRKNGVNNKHSKAVVGVHKRTAERVEFYSIKQAERELGINNSHIYSCCIGREAKRKNGYRQTYQSAGGYAWSFKERNATC